MSWHKTVNIEKLLSSPLCCESAKDSLTQTHSEETGHDALSPQVFQEAGDRTVTHFDL